MSKLKAISKQGPQLVRSVLRFGLDQLIHTVTKPILRGTPFGGSSKVSNSDVLDSAKKFKEEWTKQKPLTETRL
ncbi:MAG: hypothetical protein AABX38_07595 [Candidatus Micrarchaeota archaeon]